MKKILLLFLSLTLIFTNEFALVYLSPDKQIGIDYLIKIRFFNLIIFVTLLIIYLYYENYLRLNFTKKTLFFIFYLFSIDFLSGYAQFGYPTNEKDSIRYIFPYDWVRGEPNVSGHNEFGFRGVPPNTERDEKKFVIGFFGGSTGYAGSPPIIDLISQELKKNNLDNISINFSSVSSNHNQHLHRLLEFYEYEYDVIVFYGGSNETLTHYYYDSRPGYPYNFYLHDSNANKDLNFLIKKSNIIGEIDKIFSVYFKFDPKTSNEKDYKNWRIGIKNNYFDTIKKAKDITEKMIKPNRCKKTSFIGIFQPMAPFNNRTENLVSYIRSDLEKNDIFDLSNLTTQLNFIDHSHIDQKSKEIVAYTIFPLVKSILENKDLC